MTTLLLDTSTWDICLGADGNVAVATAPYALAQDACSQIKLFLGELYYDTAQGVPYWQEILGYLPRVSLIRAKLQQAALLVPGVVSAQVFITSLANRDVRGQVQITDANGNTATTAF